jgi:endonuclease/exonuclease/phosphatase (EEP) superfamily protein YafD
LLVRVGQTAWRPTSIYTNCSATDEQQGINTMNQLQPGSAAHKPSGQSHVSAALPSWRVTVERLVQSLLWLMAASLLLWNLLRLWPGERLAPVAAVNYFAPWVAIALLPAVLLAWLMRQRVLALALLTAVLLLVIRIAPLCLPKPQSVSPPSALKAMTFNIHQRNGDLAAILRVIDREEPDIVALQEIDYAVSLSLRQAIAARYSYHTLPANRPIRGQAILSRYPLAQVSSEANYRFQSALVRAPAGDVVLWNLHAPSLFPIGWRRDWQKQQRFFEDLTARMQRIDVPLIVAGDLNTTDLSEHYASMRPYLSDAFRQVGCSLGFTFPATAKFDIRLPSPVVRIDYVLYNSYLTAHSAYVVRDSGGSDHRPVVAILSLLE